MSPACNQHTDGAAGLFEPQPSYTQLCRSIFSLSDSARLACAQVKKYPRKSFVWAKITETKSAAMSFLTSAGSVNVHILISPNTKWLVMPQNVFANVRQNFRGSTFPVLETVDTSRPDLCKISFGKPIGPAHSSQHSAIIETEQSAYILPLRLNCLWIAPIIDRETFPLLKAQQA